MENTKLKETLIADNIQLYCGDCLQIMPILASQNTKVNAIITDVPYGTTSCQWDSILPFDKMWSCIHDMRADISTPILLFGMEPFSSLLRTSNLEEFKYDIYWQKERATNIFQMNKRPGKVIEVISVFYQNQCTYNPQMEVYTGPKRTNKIGNGKLGALIDSHGNKPKEYIDTGKRFPLQIIKFKRDILTSNLHPTQKPLALMEYLVSTYTNVGDLVLDFTMGSGTTGVACKNLGRAFIGIESNNEYFNIAVKRIKGA